AKPPDARARIGHKSHFPRHRWRPAWYDPAQHTRTGDDATKQIRARAVRRIWAWWSGTDLRNPTAGSERLPGKWSLPPQRSVWNSRTHNPLRARAGRGGPAV